MSTGTISAPHLIGLIDAQVLWRRVALVVAVLNFIGMMFFFAKWATVPPPVSTSDRVRTYAFARYNFTPETVKAAYTNPLQYQPLDYDQVIKPDLDTITSEGLHSFFDVEHINKNKGIYQVSGRRLLYTVNAGQYTIVKDTEQQINIGQEGGLFYEVGD